VAVVDAPAKLDAGVVPSCVKEHLERFLPDELPAKVVIKPNLCDIVSWEMGVTSDPAWIPILANAMRARRADVQIQLVESDAVSAYRSYRSCDETFDRLGFRDVAKRENVELVNLSRERSWEVTVPGFTDPLRVPELFFEDFFYVSLANVKVHPYERFTGTLKNGLGLLPQADISGYHMRLPEVILAMYRLCTPDLAILDGRIGLEGKGPIIGEPKLIGKVILGNNGLAVDETACRLIGVSRRQVPHLRFVARAVGHDSNSVEVTGDVSSHPFEFDPQGAHQAILTKFAIRRFCRRLEGRMLRAYGLWQAFKNKPLGFARRIARRLVRRNAA
jgi:uncharacterized protein (DUF362 family)